MVHGRVVFLIYRRCCADTGHAVLPDIQLRGRCWDCVRHGGLQGHEASSQQAAPLKPRTYGESVELQYAVCVVTMNGVLRLSLSGDKDLNVGVWTCVQEGRNLTHGMHT